MINFKKYALAAALVIPSVIGFGAKDSEAAKLAIDKNLAQGVNVRTEAKVGDNVIGLIDDREKSYEVISEEGDWTKIDFNGKEAYVVTKWFHVLENTKLVADANFRDGADLDSNVIEVLKADTEVEVLGLAENGYVKVKANDKEGYVFIIREYMEFEDNRYESYVSDSELENFKAKCFLHTLNKYRRSLHVVRQI